MSIAFQGMRDGTAGEDENGNKTVSEIYLYYVNDKEMPYECLIQPEIPSKGTPYTGNYSLKRTDVSAAVKEGDNTHKAIEVTVTYGIPKSAQFESKPDKDGNDILPWDRPVDNYTVDTIDNILPFDFGYEINDAQWEPSIPVTSSVGTPLGATTNKPTLHISFTYWVQTFTEQDVLNFFNTVNKSDITIAGVLIPAKSAVLRKLDYLYKRDYNEDGTLKYSYYEMHIGIEIKPEGWQRRLGNTSTYVLGADGKIARCYYDGMGKKGVWGFGTKADLLADGSNINDIAPTDAAIPLTLQNNDAPGGDDPEDSKPSIVDGKYVTRYIDFYDKFEADWSSLNIPTTKD